MLLALTILGLACGFLMWRWAPEGLRGQYAFLGFVFGPIAFLLLLSASRVKH